MGGGGVSTMDLCGICLIYLKFCNFINKKISKSKLSIILLINFNKSSTIQKKVTTQKMITAEIIFKIK